MNKVITEELIFRPRGDWNVPCDEHIWRIFMYADDLMNKPGIAVCINCAKMESGWIKPKNCQHEFDGNIYTSNPPQNKCKKCGDFYR